MTAIFEAYGFRDHASVVAWVCKTYGIRDNQYANEHRVRRERIAQRLRLYRDDGRAEFERIIDRIFTKTDVREQRKAMIDVATELNVTQRITHEVASLYDQPAVRELADRAKQEAFKQLCLNLQIDEVMQEAQRLTFVCNETLLWRTHDAELGDELRVITPDLFDAVPHPRRALKPIGFLIDAAPVYVPEGTLRACLPHYELWDDTYKYLISAEGNLVDAAGNTSTEPVKHGLKRIPGVLLHRRKPSDRLLDDRAGRDIISAHLGAGLLEVMAMRLMKSQGERQPILKGNLASMAMGQSMDGEKPLLLPPEVVAEMLDTQTDPDHYMRKKKEKVTSVGATYGLSYEQMMNTDSAEAQSGKVFQMRRLKLTEIRREQARRWLVHERDTTELLDEDPKGARYDFQEQTIPADATEEMGLLKDRVAFGLDSPVKFLQRKNPDLSKQQVLELIDENLQEYQQVIEKVRALNMPSDADANDPGKSPEENGGDNQVKGREDARAKIATFSKTQQQPDLKALARKVLNAA
jgi:hypothetical protein